MKLAVPVLVILVGLGIYFAMRPVSETSISTNHQTGNSANVALPNESRIETNSAKSAAVSLEINTNASRAEAAEQIAAITEASTKSDAGSFQMIIRALKDENPEIREVALDAAIQFGSRDAIPVLQQLAAKTEDAREKVKILDAIDFLEMPTFSEIKKARQTNSNLNRIPVAPK